MRRLLFASALLFLSCAGFKAVERPDEWRRVWAKAEGAHPPESPQKLISRDAHERELANSVNRTWSPPPGYKALPFGEEEPLRLKVGELKELVVPEKEAAELFIDGDSVELFWNPAKNHDEWKDGSDVTVKDSTLYLRGVKAGKTMLKLVRGDETQDLAVLVKAKKGEEE